MTDSATFAAMDAPVSTGRLPNSVDLRPRFLHWSVGPRAQGSRGTCSVFAVTGALEYAAAARSGHGCRLSVEFLNWAGHEAAHRTADGGFFSDLWSGFEKHGICPEDDLPYQAAYDSQLQPGEKALEDAARNRKLRLNLHWIKEWDVKTGLTPEQLATVRRTLAHGWPVCGGLRWPKQARWVDGLLQMCGPEAVFDGHSVLLVGYRDAPDSPGGGVFLIRNSGSDGPDGALSYEYVSAYMNDAAWCCPA